MTTFNRRLMIILPLIILLFVLLNSRCKINLNARRKFLVTIVDYRWNPIANLSVQIETKRQGDHEYYTDNQGTVEFTLENSSSNDEYISISINGITEKILPNSNGLTIRLDMINRDTGEMYHDDYDNFN